MNKVRAFSFAAIIGKLLHCFALHLVRSGERKDLVERENWQTWRTWMLPL
jgi:hypothetical protein